MSANLKAATRGQDVPVLDLDPYSEETLISPFAFQKALREIGPVAYIPKYRIYATGRHAVVHTVMTDHQRFTSEGGIGLTDIRKPGALRAPSPISEVDPPRHTGVRAALMKVISPVVIRQWREIFLAEAETVVAQALARGEVDGVADVVQAFVLKAFTDALGVKMPREHFLDIGEMNFNQMGPDNEILRRSMAKVGPILDTYQQAFQRESMLPGGFGEKIFEAEDRGEFEKGTAGVQVRSFLRAGVDTTIAGIGETLKLLAENPAEWAKVKADPAKVKGALEEGIRLGSPAQIIFRTTNGPTELEGYHLDGDAKVGLFLGAANRDERKFPDPDRFDIDRDTAGVHLALGAGIHICIGQNIARLEAECILSALVRKIDRIELAGKPAYRPVNALRTLDHLPLRLVASR